MSQFCIACGIENQDEAKFCKSCGQKLKTEEYQESDKKEKESYSENISDGYQNSSTKSESFSLFSFSGCVSRKTYWAIQVAFISVPFLIGLVLALTVPAILSTGFKFDFPSIDKEKLVILVIVPVLLWLWVNIATSIKRLRDANFSAWLYWLNIIPYLGTFIILLLYGFFPSVEQGNKYCKSKNNLSSKAIKWIYIISLVSMLLIGMAIVVPKFINEDLKTKKYTASKSTFEKEKIVLKHEYVVLDGLMWQDEPYTEAEDNARRGEKNYRKSQDWEGANSYCRILTLAGHDDWRLPTKKELFSIVDMSRKPCIKQEFDNATTKGYWSSTTGAFITPDDAWVIYFYDGYQNYYPKKYHNYVRCVRAGQ